MNAQETGRRLTLHPAFEQKTVHILVRWLLIILAFHFMATSGIAPGQFSLAVKISCAFILSNVALMALPRRYFSPGPFVRWLVAADFAFIGLTVYFVREPGAFYHWLYIAALLVLLLMNSVRVPLLGLAGGLVALSVGGGAVTGRWLPSSDTGDFIRVTIVFSVAVLYFFVLQLLEGNARLFHIVARAKQEWERTADAMSELILLVDQDGAIHRVNRSLANRLGKTPAELVGKPWCTVLDGSETASPDTPLSRMFASRTLVQAVYNHRTVGADAQTIAVPLFEGDTLAGAIYILRPFAAAKAPGLS
jgi:PAS domain-containing protein